MVIIAQRFGFENRLFLELNLGLNFGLEYLLSQRRTRIPALKELALLKELVKDIIKPYRKLLNCGTA
jgi:hypothetical protein